MIFIVEQVYIFMYAILGGAIVAFLYDMLRIKRRTIKTSIKLVSLEDMLYWLTAAIVLFLVVYRSNSGEMRGYIFIGNIIGVLLYESILSNIVIAYTVSVINIIKRLLKFIFKVLSYPLKIVYKLIITPILFVFGKLFKLLKALFKKIKNSNIKIINRIRKGFKNIGNRRKSA